MQQTQDPFIQRRDDVKFQAEITSLIKEAEDMRLKRMQDHRGRRFTLIFAGLLSLLAGGAGFGWFFLMQANLTWALICMGVAVLPPFLLMVWAEQPVKTYASAYKADFMPRLAEAFGGLRFFPERGISSKIINRTGAVPSYDIYEAEDCFMGVYKGVKVIFSEARLYKKSKRRAPVFDGIFALLEIPEGLIEGHTIITSDQARAKSWAHSRWQKLQPVAPAVKDASTNRFSIYSDTPDAAGLIAGERLLKELADASDVFFAEGHLTAVLFRGKYIFLMIDAPQDMFEASEIHAPITTRQHALNCKKEIDCILEIIDIFELYRNTSSLQ